MRFMVRHAPGAQANYAITTPILSLAVRGATGLLADGPAGDVLVCVACSEGNAVVTVDGEAYALLTGQTMIVSPNAAVSVDVTADITLQQFQGAGLPTTAGPQR